MRRRLAVAAVAALTTGMGLGAVWPQPAPPPPPLTVDDVTAADVEAITEAAGPIVWPARPAARPAKVSRSKPRGPVCTDEVARVLHRAGFRGTSLRVAWAVVMRESRGQNLGADSPYFTGAYGIFQVQESAHSGKPWYSRSAMLDPERQARLVYVHLSARGTDWRHWGLRILPSGDVTTDTTYYSGWSADQVARWITNPFIHYYNTYPC